MFLLNTSAAICFIFIFCLTIFPKYGRAEKDCQLVQQGMGQSGLSESLDAVTQKALNAHRLVGSVVLVSQNNRLIYHKASGYADREHALPMQEKTLFRLSSVSKIYTSLAIATLVTQGKLSFDDEVTKWLPYFTPPLPNGKKSIITIRQLLSHTAGLSYTFAEAPNGPYHTAGVSDGLDNRNISLEENLRRLASVPLLYEPGKGWCYSMAMDVLGGVVEKVTGEHLPNAMQLLIGKPLGLSDSSYFLEDTSRLAVPYYTTSSGELRKIEDSSRIDIGLGAEILFAPERITNKKAFPSGGAGMVATASDVMVLLEVIRKAGAPIIRSDIMHEMNRAYTNGIGRHGWNHALGWQILSNPAKAKSPQAKGTVGWGGVYGHSWFVDPVNNISVVILTNTTPEGLYGQFLTDICEVIYTYSN